MEQMKDFYGHQIDQNNFTFENLDNIHPLEFKDKIDFGKILGNTLKILNSKDGIEKVEKAWDFFNNNDL